MSTEPGVRRDRRHRPDHRADRVARREARRTELLDSAIRAIRRDGPTVSMEALAAEAGVTKPIIYKHFGDRDGLASAVADRFTGPLVEALDTALMQSLPPRDLLRGTIDTYLAFVERDPNVYRFLIGRLAQPLVGDVHGLVGVVGSRVAIVLGEQLRVAGHDSGAAEPWAFGIVGLVHLAGDWWVERQTMTRDRLADYLTDLLWSGLGSFDSNRKETS